VHQHQYMSYFCIPNFKLGGRANTTAVKASSPLITLRSSLIPAQQHRPHHLTNHHHLPVHTRHLIRYLLVHLRHPRTGRPLVHRLWYTSHRLRHPSRWSTTLTLCRLLLLLRLSCKPRHSLSNHLGSEGWVRPYVSMSFS
jgi:hypothetical protein